MSLPPDWAVAPACKLTFRWPVVRLHILYLGHPL